MRDNRDLDDAGDKAHRAVSDLTTAERAMVYRWLAAQFAAPLDEAMGWMPGGLVYEAHSTAYQSAAALAGRVDHRLAILKVGPELTFALREAILSLSLIEQRLVARDRRADPIGALLTAMDADPRHWAHDYRGDPDAIAFLKLSSYSDRARYYWGVPAVAGAVAQLMGTLADTGVPEPLVPHFFPHLAGEDLPGRESRAAALLKRHVQTVAARYYAACRFA